jgi:hypothetical protein
LSKSKPKYFGPLAEGMEPIHYIQLLGLSEEQKQGIFSERNEQFIQKLVLLFDFYKIKRGDWHLLAARLAEEHVPGFQDAKNKGGSPVKWSELEKAQLRLAIDRVVGEKNISISSAAAQLAKREPWKSLAKGRNPAETLRRKYHDPRDEFWQQVAQEISHGHEDVKKP